MTLGDASFGWNCGPCCRLDSRIYRRNSSRRSDQEARPVRGQEALSAEVYQRPLAALCLHPLYRDLLHLTKLVTGFGLGKAGIGHNLGPARGRMPCEPFLLPIAIGR
jgi:hypothetical protein